MNLILKFSLIHLTVSATSPLVCIKDPSNLTWSNWIPDLQSPMPDPPTIFPISINGYSLLLMALAKIPGIIFNSVLPVTSYIQSISKSCFFYLIKTTRSYTPYHLLWFKSWPSLTWPLSSPWFQFVPFQDIFIGIGERWGLQGSDRAGQEQGAPGGGWVKAARPSYCFDHSGCHASSGLEGGKGTCGRNVWKKCVQNCFGCSLNFWIVNCKAFQIYWKQYQPSWTHYQDRS